MELHNEIYDTYINMSPDNIVDLCRSNDAYNTICNDETFWGNKISRDYGNIRENFGLSNKELYINIYEGNIKKVQLINQYEDTYTWLYKYEPIQDLVHRVVDYLFELYPEYTQYEFESKYFKLVVMAPTVGGYTNDLYRLSFDDVPIKTVKTLVGRCTYFDYVPSNITTLDSIWDQVDYIIMSYPGHLCKDL